jgi:hypothetical protein
MGHSYKMMGRWKGLEDRAAVQRAALDKRWRWHWAREDKICSACGDPSVGIIHPLRHCKNADVIKVRDRWRARIEMFVRAAPPSQRSSMEGLWRCMNSERLGGYACCGVFLPAFLDSLSRADDILSKKDRTRLNKLLREIGKGAREILRVHTEINIINRAVDLRQLSMVPFLVKSKNMGDDEGEMGQGKAKARPKTGRKAKGAKKRPPPESDEENNRPGDNNKEEKLKTPVSYKKVASFIMRRTVLGGGVGRVTYWEWKAG